jgi:hypothetical protein
MAGVPPTVNPVWGYALRMYMIAALDLIGARLLQESSPARKLLFGWMSFGGQIRCEFWLSMIMNS